MAKAVCYEIAAGIGRITLSAPGSGNGLNVAVFEQLRRSIQAAQADGTCRVIVLGAEGPHFSTGLDFGAALGEDTESDLEGARIFMDCMALLCRSSLPVVAAVEGDVSGGGLGLVAACDLVIAAEQVTFMLPEVIVGMIPALIAPFLLRRLTPAGLRYMTLSTRGIQAEEAQVFGLADEVARGELAPVLRRQLKRLLRSSPRALAESKRYVEQLCETDLTRQMETAFAEFCMWIKQPEVLEGTRLFAQGFRPPWFQRLGHEDPPKQPQTDTGGRR